MPTTYIALGSNLNNPSQQLERAIAALQKIPHITLLARSHFYQTTPVGFIAQPDFINAVVCLETTLSPRVLLSELHRIEAEQNRVRKEKNGPRTLDLDILLYGNGEIAEEDLVIPHPRLQERAFVLVPLVEIAPGLVLPNGESVESCLITLRDVGELGVRIGVSEKAADF